MTDEDALLAVNDAYYDAFATGDFDAMSHIWADEAISCVHPGWSALIGREAVIESYRNILGNPNHNGIETRGARVVLDGDEGRVFCFEIVGHLALMATNWFRRIDGRWRLIHHQASPVAMPAEEDSQALPRRRLN